MYNEKSKNLNLISRYFLRQKPQKLHKTQSTPNLADGSFSAIPFPSHIFSGYAYEMMKVNKEYREIQKATRYIAID